MLTCVRTSELRCAEWAAFQIDAAEPVELILRRERQKRPRATILQAVAAELRKRKKPIVLGLPPSMICISTPERVARLYSDARRMMKADVELAIRWEKIATDVEASIERLGWPDVIEERLHVLSAERQWSALSKRAANRRISGTP